MNNNLLLSYSRSVNKEREYQRKERTEEHDHGDKEETLIEGG